MAMDKENKVIQVGYRYKFEQKTVFDAIAAGRLFASCGGRMNGFENDFRVGGKYQFSWAPGKIAFGTILEIRPHDLIRFSWTENEEPSEVTIRLSKQGNFTQLDLTHEKVTNIDRMHSFHQGWTEVLALFTDELDGTTLRLSQNFNVSVESLYQAVAKGELFRHNGAPKDFKLEMKVGAKFEFACGKGDSISGEVLKMVENDSISFTWRAKCPMDSGETTVLLFFKKLNDKSSQLWIVHDGFVNSTVTKAHFEAWSSDLQDFAKSMEK